MIIDMEQKEDNKISKYSNTFVTTANQGYHLKHPWIYSIKSFHFMKKICIHVSLTASIHFQVFVTPTRSQGDLCFGPRVAVRTLESDTGAAEGRVS